VYLPNGVEIDWLAARIADLSASDITVSLIRVSNFAWETTDTVATFSSSGNTGPDYVYTEFGVAADDTYADVLYPFYSYYVETCLPSGDFRLNQMRIYYSGDELVFEGLPLRRQLHQLPMGGRPGLPAPGRHRHLGARVDRGQ